MGEKLLPDEWFAVVNPNAGNGKGEKDWKRIADLLDKNGIKYSMKHTEKR